MKSSSALALKVRWYESKLLSQFVVLMDNRIHATPALVNGFKAVLAAGQ
jgi:hypothetical protein